MSAGACFADAFGSNILTSLADAQHLKRVGTEFMTKWLMPCYTCEPAFVFRSLQVRSTDVRLPDHHANSFDNLFVSTLKASTRRRWHY
jgi:hypothetical protein